MDFILEENSLSQGFFLANFSLMIFRLGFQKWLVDSRSSSRRPRLRRKLPRQRSSRVTVPTTRRRLHRKPWFTSAACARFVEALCCYRQQKSEITIDFTMYFYKWVPISIVPLQSSALQSLMRCSNFKRTSILVRPSVQLMLYEAGSNNVH